MRACGCPVLLPRLSGESRAGEGCRKGVFHDGDGDSTMAALRGGNVRDARARARMGANGGAHGTRVDSQGTTDRFIAGEGLGRLGSGFG